MSEMNGKQKYYKISEDKLRELIVADAILQALESGGVDNWGWYSESRQEYLEDYFSDREPQWFEENDPDFYMLAEIEMERFKEV